MVSNQINRQNSVNSESADDKEVEIEIEEEDKTSKLNLISHVTQSPKNGEASSPAIINTKREKRIVVFITVKIKNISEIDTVKQCFGVSGHLYISIHKSVTRNLRNKLELTIENATNENESKIKINDEDYKEIQYENENINTKFELGDEKWIRFKRTFNVVCWEKLELQSFPFDVQELTINFVVNDQFVLLPEPTLKATSPKTPQSPGKTHDNEIKAFADVQAKYFLSPEFNLKEPSIQFQITSKGSKSHIEYSHFLFNLTVSRKWYSYHPIIIPMVIISGLSLVAFAIDRDNLSDRFNYLITLLLVFVSFQTVVRGMLPAISEFTLMDVFIYAMFGIIAAMVIESACLTLPSFEHTDEHIVAYYFIGCWITMNLLFVAYATKVYYQERNALYRHKTRLDLKSPIEPGTEAEVHEIDDSMYIYVNDEKILNAYDHLLEKEIVNYCPLRL